MFAPRGVCGIASVIALLLTLRADAGLVGYWKFEETGGNIVHNEVPGGPDGVLSGGASFVPTGGFLNSQRSLMLDHATNGLASFGDNYSFPSGSYSVVAWVKTNPGDTTGMFPVSKHIAGSANGYYLALNDVGDGASSSSAGRAHFTRAGWYSGHTQIVNDGQWHMLVGFYESYFNYVGVSADLGGSGSRGPATPNVTNDAPLLLGGIVVGGSPTNSFTGLIDEVHVYDHVISIGEIRNLYFGTIPEPGAGAALAICFWWQMRRPRRRVRRDASP